ncbi:MAG: serine/threonine protein kinase [Phycisphaerae bacterium]|nr:serine/threonine protein kinase [Phycisphaerae bacterium]
MLESRRLAAGEVIGGCRLEAEIGRGGMGSVWRAVQSNPARVVAVKFLHESATSSSADAESRFRREARLLGRLRHPSIATIYSAGVHESRDRRVPYLVMEFVDGARTIVQAARDDSLSIKRRVEMLAVACEAIGEAHVRGLVHRDIKPSNVLVDSTGAPRVIDFGIARADYDAAGESAFATKTGQLLGTPQYMSPEQFGDDPELVDARSDVYALGLLIFETLTGRPPYDLRGVGLKNAIRIVCEIEPDSLREALPACSRDLDTIVSKCLAKSPDSRYASASVLATDLRCLLAGDPISARPLTAAYHAQILIRRHPLATAGLVASLLIISALVLLFLWQRNVAIRTSDESKLVAAAYEIDSGAIAIAQQRLASVSGEGRGWIWRALVRASGAIRPATLSDTYLYNLASFADDTKLVAIARGVLHILEPTDRRDSLKVAESQMLPPFRNKTQSTYPECIFVDASEDGAIVAFSHADDETVIVRVWDRTHSELLYQSPTLRLSAPVALTSSGDKLVFALEDHSLALVSGLRRPASGGISTTFIPLPSAFAGEISTISLNLGESLVAVGTYAGGIAVVDLNGGLPTVVRSTDDGSMQNPRVRDVIWTRDGSRLLAAVDGGEILSIPLNKTAIPVTRVISGGLRDIAETPDGKEVLGLCANETMVTLRSDDLQVLSRTAVHSSELWCAALLNDGSTLAIGAAGALAIPVDSARVSAPVRTATFDESGGLLLVQDSAGMLNLHRVVDCRLSQPPLLTWLLDPPPLAIDLRPYDQGVVVAALHADGSVELRDSPSDRIERFPPPEVPAEEIFGSRGDAAIRISKDLGSIAAGWRDNRVRVINRGTGESLTLDPMKYHSKIEQPESGISAIYSLHSSQENTWLVAAQGFPRLTSWCTTRDSSAFSGKLSPEIPLVTASTKRDSTLYVGDPDGRLGMIDLIQMRTKWYRQILGGPARCIAVHPRLDLLAAADQSTLWIVEASTGRPILSLDTLAAKPVAMAFVADRDALIIFDENGICAVWNGDESWPTSFSGFTPLMKPTYESNGESDE